MPNANALSRLIDDCLDRLKSKKVVASLNTTIVRRGAGGQATVIWNRDSDDGLMFRSDVAGYLSLVERREYSALMADGGALQLLYGLVGEELTGHRLVFFPCPFEGIELGQHADVGIADRIREAVHSGKARERLVSPIRFDYAPGAAKEGKHPASHFTINGKDCRIPVSSPVSPIRFLLMVIRNWYPAAYDDQRRRIHKLRPQELPLEDLFGGCIADVERQQIHVLTPVGPIPDADPAGT